VEKIILDIPFSYRDVAFKAGARWDSEIKAYLFEKQSGQALLLELEGFEPKQFSWEEKTQRELNGGAFPIVPAQKSITLRSHQLAAVEEIFSAYKKAYPGFLLADDCRAGKDLRGMGRYPQNCRKLEPDVEDTDRMPPWRRRQLALEHSMDGD
jgi:hypothetical protein